MSKSSQDFYELDFVDQMNSYLQSLSGKLVKHMLDRLETVLLFLLAIHTMVTLGYHKQDFHMLVIYSRDLKHTHLVMRMQETHTCSFLVRTLLHKLIELLPECRTLSSCQHAYRVYLQ